MWMSGDGGGDGHGHGHGQCHWIGAIADGPGGRTLDAGDIMDLMATVFWIGVALVVGWLAWNERQERRERERERSRERGGRAWNG